MECKRVFGKSSCKKQNSPKRVFSPSSSASPCEKEFESSIVVLASLSSTRLQGNLFAHSFKHKKLWLFSFLNNQMMCIWCEIIMGQCLEEEDTSLRSNDKKLELSGLNAGNNFVLALSTPSPAYKAYIHGERIVKEIFDQV